VLDEASGGVETMQSYIKAHAGAILARRSDAPVVVVLDWDSSNKLNTFQKLIDAPDVYKVSVWNPANANPRAGKSFKGIERFYSDRLVNEAMKRTSSIATKGSGEWVVHPSDYPVVKQTLAAIVEEGIDAKDLSYCDKYIRSLLRLANASA
jgi:hypothetical protein